jgi:hypothetical protein
MWLLFAFATFAGAVLSFSVQPLVGRVLLPVFGGTPGVWVTCLALFQLGLLLGYALVHGLVTRVGLRAQVVFVGLLLLAAGLSGPLRLDVDSLAPSDAPGWTIAVFFARHVALAYVALALAAPLLQRWYTGLTHTEPYHLYAISNAGSFVGLLGYPLVVEPLLDLPAQAATWSTGFLGYAACMAAAGVMVLRADALPPSASKLTAPWRSRVNWVLLAAAPSALLGAISNHVTTDVAATPLLWVVPLSLYLATFIVAFSALGLRWPRVHHGLWIAVTVVMPVLLVPKNQVPLPIMLGAPLLTLYLGASLCHAELAARRPPSEQASGYYLCIALGGALGGGFVGLVAPRVFLHHHELPLAMLAIHTLLLVKALRDNRVNVVPTGEMRLSWLGFGLGVPLLCAALVSQTSVSSIDGQLIARSRNFFGPLRVADMPPMRVLRHGRTNHGMQFLDPARKHEPVAYYGVDSGVSRVLRTFMIDRPRNLGVLGLGVGTLAAYAKSNDQITFYEIDPAVTAMAQRHFTFLKDSATTPRIVHGDGRLLLAAEHDRPPYDVLVIDAFSSDSVPVHLLTHEAFSVYLARLAPGGVLALNVSNRHLSVERAAMGAARAHGLSALMLDTPADIARGYARVRFVLAARKGVVLARFEGAPARTVEVPNTVLFHDRRASLLSLIR